MISCQDKKITEDIYSLSEMEIRFLNQSLPDNLKSADYNAKQSFIQKITKDLERQNKEKRFIKNYVEKYGYPDWQMVRWFKSNGETVAHIPLFFDNGTVTQAVMLVVEYDNKIKFRLFERDNFEKYAKNKKPVPNAEIIKDLFIIFDFQKFGESRYLPNGIIYAENKSSKLKSVSESILIEDCYYISTYTEKYGWSEARTNCITYYVWWNIEHSNPEDTGGDSGDWFDPSANSPIYPTPNTCLPGYALDKSGKCVKKPCAGNPVQNPEIAPQANSGIQGGLHNTCVRRQENSICDGKVGYKLHDGIDLKNAFGEPIFAMYDGYAILGTETDKETGSITGAGYYVGITSNINGQNVRLVFFHLQNEGRITGQVKAGDIIGYQGDSGNLKNAIKQKLTISHVHVKAKVNGSMGDPLLYFGTIIDPNTGQVTNPCN